MADKVNIKNLPEAEEIKSGDFLVIETSTGTYVLDHKNFTVSLGNTTFASTLSTHTADIAVNYAFVQQLSGSMNLNTATVAAVSGLSGIQWKGSYDNSSTYSQSHAVYYSTTNSSYIAKQNVPAGTAPSDTTYWDFLAKSVGVDLPLSRDSELLTHDGTDFITLSAGNAGTFLKSQGTNSPIVWQSPDTGRASAICKSLVQEPSNLTANETPHGTYYLMTDNAVKYAGYQYYGHAARGTEDDNDVHYMHPQPCNFDHNFDRQADIVKKVYGEGAYRGWVITESGKLFMTGYGDYGQAGKGDTSNRDQFEMLDKWYTQSGTLESERPFIVDIKQGGMYWRSYYGTMYALTSSGDVYSWGYNSHGQCGLGHTNSPVTKPHKIESFNSPSTTGPVSAIFPVGGYGSCFAVLTGGQVYAWGRNYDYQLGINSDEDSISTPSGPISKIHGTVKMVNICNGGYYSSGWYHYPEYCSSFALLSSGELFSAGRNHAGILGTGHNDADGWHRPAQGSPIWLNRRNGSSDWMPLSACDYFDFVAVGNNTTEEFTYANHGLSEGEPLYLPEYDSGSMSQGKTGTTTDPHMYWVGFDGVSDTTNNFRLYYHEHQRDSSYDVTIGTIPNARFCRMRALTGVKDFDIASTYHPHGVALTDEGDVYVWGRNYNGQLGLGHRDNLPYSSTDVNGNTRSQACPIRLNNIHRGGTTTFSNALSSPFDNFDIRGTHRGAPNTVVKVRAQGTGWHGNDSRDYSSQTWLQDDEGQLYAVGETSYGQIPFQLYPHFTSSTHNGRSSVNHQYFRKLILPCHPSEIAEWNLQSWITGFSCSTSIRTHDGKVFWGGAHAGQHYMGGAGAASSGTSHSYLYNTSGWVQTQF